MPTLRRLLYGEMLRTIVWVVAGFTALFFFFDLVEELQSVARHAASGYQLSQALLVVALLQPSHWYELLPIAVLIGSIFVMARMAQSSEFTILRTSGLGPGRALRVMLGLGLIFVLLTFALGDYLAPISDRSAQLLKARYSGRITVGQTGAWLKERQDYARYAVNVGELASDDTLKAVRVFEFNNAGQLISITQAAQAQVQSGAWLLQEVQRSEFPGPDSVGAPITLSRKDRLTWRNQLSAEMVSAALLKPERMRAIDLFGYVRHLQANGQSALRYEIEFWKKVFYPLSCLVMVVLATPFAYLHFRSGGIGAHVFGGILVGISFFLLNNVSSYLGNLHDWAPWLAAGLPGLLYSLASLAAFTWMVLRR